MTIFNFPLDSERDLHEAIELTGADKRSFPFFERKREVMSFYLPGIDYRAANALKQELLSRGGDVIVNKKAIEGTVRLSNVVIMGSRKSLKDLSLKLKVMPYWGLDGIGLEIDGALERSSVRRWRLHIPGREDLTLGESTRIMGIVNANENSFYSGSRGGNPGSCAAMARQMYEDGADIIDIGSESTRPGSLPLSQRDEADLLIPAVSAVRTELPEAVISVDTYRADTAAQALEAGADMVNDISAGLFDKGMFPLVAKYGIPVILMHAKDGPGGMHTPAEYGDIIGEMVVFLSERMEAAAEAGIDPGQIILDPGIGFSKNAVQSLKVLERIDSFSALGRPLLVGHSRKSAIGRALGLDDPAQRLEGTLAVSSFCAVKRISLIRVHDVLQNFRTVRMIETLKGENF